MDLRGKSSEFIRNLCRMCMCSRASVDMGRNTSIYKQYLHEKPTGGNGQQHLTIVELLQSVQPNLINETEDKLPQVLCLRCIDQLQTTYEFLQMCRDSDKRYRKVLLEIPPQIHSEDSNVDHLNSDEEFSFVTVKQEEFLDMEVSTHSGNYGELEMSLSGQHTNNHSDDNDDEWTPTGKRRKTANTKNYKLAKPNESNSTANRLPPPNEEDGIPCRECGKVLANVSLWEKHLADCRLGISPNNEERNTVNINMTGNHSIASKDQTHANTSIAHNSSISKQLIGQVISVGGTLIETAGTALKSPNNDLELNRFPSPSSVHSERFQSDPYDSPSSETTRNFHSKEDLQTFLEQKHLLVFGNFKANGKLSNIERVKISKDIIQHLLIMNPSRRLTTSELEHISELIAQVFVGELATTFYRKYIQGRHASGKLHDAYNNYRTMLAASGLITRRPKSKNTTNQLEDDEVSLTVNKLDDKKEAKLVRLLSKEVHLEKCLDAWQKTFLRRQQQLKTMPSPDIYIKQYPVLTQANGYRLMLIDAEILNRKHITLEIPPTFVQRIIGQIKSRSETVIVILKLIDMEKNENNKSIVTLMLLPYLFPSSVKKVKNGVIKMTKAECADSFICHFWDLESAESGVKKLLANHTELSPFMVFIGSPISAAWVVVGQIKYSFEDLSSCLKCAIAAYLALNIKYPQHSEKAWFFLQKYIFNISTSNDTLLENSVKTFANDLNLIAK